MSRSQRRLRFTSSGPARILGLVRRLRLLSPICTASFGFALWIAAGTAHADAYDAAVRDGVTARDRARETLDQADWRRAYEHFRRALALSPTSDARFEMAEAAAGMRLIAIAYDHYERALEQGLSGLAAARAQAFIEAHRRDVAHLVLDPPAGSSVYVNSRLREVVAGHSMAVPVGAVTIRVDLPGYASWRKNLWTLQAVRHRVRVSLVPLVPGTAARHEDQSDGPRWVAPTLWTGGTLLIAGAATTLATTVLLSGARQDLADHCDVLEAGRCRAATLRNHAAAQDAADRVETFQSVRWIAVPAMLLGAAAVGAALTLPHLGSDDVTAGEVGISPLGPGFSVVGRF